MDIEPPSKPSVRATIAAPRRSLTVLHDACTSITHPVAGITAWLRSKSAVPIVPVITRWAGTSHWPLRFTVVQSTLIVWAAPIGRSVSADPAGGKKRGCGGQVRQGCAQLTTGLGGIDRLRTLLEFLQVEVATADRIVQHSNCLLAFPIAHPERVSVVGLGHRADFTDRPLPAAMPEVRGAERRDRARVG